MERAMHGLVSSQTGHVVDWTACRLIMSRTIKLAY